MAGFRHETVTPLALLAFAAACSATPESSDSLSGGIPGDSSDNESADTNRPDPQQGCRNDGDCRYAGEGDHCDLESGICYPECSPGREESCYSGPPDTRDVGDCRAGLRTCDEFGQWTNGCRGEVLPADEDCAGNSDRDCDGLIADTDLDGDGYGQCAGDCCDFEGAGCVDSVLVNPGAYEVVGNKLDDDCDGEIDEATPTCDEALSSGSTDAHDFARALDLCQRTQENPENSRDRTWGVIDATFTQADGTGAPRRVQHSIRPGFGQLMGPEGGTSLVVLSTGHAADADDRDPEFAPFESGEDLGQVASAPETWLDANGGTFPNPSGCEAPSSTNANDSITLKLRVRAPTNARSFKVMMHFFSAEYPEYVCSQYNDFFVALLDSTADNPADQNIAIFDDDGTAWPVGVNLVMVAPGLFTQCINGTVGCAGEYEANYTGCVGNALLEGTGFDDFDDFACDPEQTQAGGGTGWLEMRGNVTPGEVFEIQFSIWDTSGHIFDSLVLLDDWTWSLDEATPGVAPG